MKLRFALVGCGAMGQVIARHLRRRWADRAHWVGFYDVSQRAAENLAKKVKGVATVMPLARLVDRADWVVEAASPSAVPDLLGRCLADKKNILVMSSGGLLTCTSLLRRAEKIGVQVLVPSGAIAGLDAIKAARLGHVLDAQITTRKSLRALAGAPYLARHGVDVLALPCETVVFEGNAADAMEGFPANINVAATLALSSGLGPKRTRVKIIADPDATRNIHQITVRGSSGSISATVENIPSDINPKTSALAVMAACAALDGIFTAVRIGT